MGIEQQRFAELPGQFEHGGPYFPLPLRAEPFVLGRRPLESLVEVSGHELYFAEPSGFEIVARGIASDR